MPQANDVVDMFLFFDEWSRCIGSRYQRDRLYRYGKFEGCSKQWKDVGIAMKAKMCKNREEAEAMVAETHYRRTLGKRPQEFTDCGHNLGFERETRVVLSPHMHGKQGKICVRHKVTTFEFSATTSQPN